VLEELIRRWKAVQRRRNYLTDLEGMISMDLNVTDQKCPGCGARVGPYQPGHASWCPWGTEKNR
jgi:hypothetical protein